MFIFANREHFKIALHKVAESRFASVACTFFNTMKFCQHIEYDVYHIYDDTTTSFLQHHQSKTWVHLFIFQFNRIYDAIPSIEEFLFLIP